MPETLCVVRSAARGLAAVSALAAASTAASAQEPAGSPWTGEASLSASAKTGNTESSDLGAGFKIARETQVWSHKAGLVFDYGEATDQDTGESEETKNRLFVDYQGQRTLSDRLFGYGRSTYELDEFDGFDYRAFIGAGLGWEIIARDTMSWSVQGGPGAQIDAFEDGSTDPNAGETVTNVAMGLGSLYANQLNDFVELTNESNATWTEDTTILFNSLGVTAQLMDSLAGRFSVDVSYDSEPVAGFESTDTTTRASLIYSFGQ